MSVALALPLAAALLAGDVPDGKRVAKLAPFFSPRPGRELLVERHEKTKAERLRGFIVVSPPKGTCFTIERAMDMEDDVVCKKTALSFTVDQLDKGGKLTWRITTGDGDFGTTLTWRTPYRRALLEPLGEDATRVAKYVDRCEADRTPGRRRIKFTFLTGERMTFELDDEDKLIQPQPDEPPNLLPISKPPPLEEMKEEAEKKKEGEGHEEKKEEKKEEKGGEHGEEKKDAAPAKKPDEPPTEAEDRKDWAVGRRGTYTLSSDHLLVHPGQTPGLHGECRYHYEGPDDDPDAGRLECHGADGYKLVYVPLPCLREVRPRTR